VVLLALVSVRAFVVAKRGAGPVSWREPQAPPPPVAKHRAVEGPAAFVRLGAFGVVASAKREVGGPRSGGVVLGFHSATGGVADVAPTERARRAESSTWFTPGSSGPYRRGTAAFPVWRRGRLRARLRGNPGLGGSLRAWPFLHFGSHDLNLFQEFTFASLDSIGGGGVICSCQSLPGER